MPLPSTWRALHARAGTEARSLHGAETRTTSGIKPPKARASGQNRYHPNPPAIHTKARASAAHRERQHRGNACDTPHEAKPVDRLTTGTTQQRKNNAKALFQTHAAESHTVGRHRAQRGAAPEPEGPTQETPGNAPEPNAKEGKTTLLRTVLREAEHGPTSTHAYSSVRTYKHADNI